MTSPDAWFACQGDIHYQDTDLTEYNTGASDALPGMQMVTIQIVENLSMILKEKFVSTDGSITTLLVLCLIIEKHPIDP